MRIPSYIILSFVISLYTALIAPAPAHGAENTPLEITVYVGFSEKEGEIFARAFSKSQRGKVKINVVKINTGKLVELLRNEGEKCMASVVFGGSLPAYLVAAEKGLFQQYRSPETKNFDKKFKDPGGMWTGIYIGIIGFAVNPKSKGVEPGSWADLLKPEFKGKISYADPGYSGTSYIMLSTLVQLMGEEKAFEYLKKLDSQVASYPHAGAEPAVMAGRGTISVGISFAHDILDARKSYPGITMSFPKEGTGLEIGGAAIPKYSPNPELARKFMDFIASPAAQNLYGTSGIPPRFPTNSAAKHPAAELTRGKTLKIIDFNFQASANNEERLQKKWADEILKPREAGK